MNKRPVIPLGLIAGLIFFFMVCTVTISFAATIILSPADIASGKDVPKDGIFESFVNPGFPSLIDNNYTEIRMAAEFNLSSVTEPIIKATLSLKALETNTPALIEIHGFSGNGQVELADIGYIGNLLGSIPGSIGTNTLDVTDFVRGIPAGGFAGFSFDEAIREIEILTNSFGEFKLVIETKEHRLAILPSILLLLD